MATDYDCWRTCDEEGVNVQAVLKTFKENVQNITKLFVHVVPKIAEFNKWDEIVEKNKVKLF